MTLRVTPLRNSKFRIKGTDSEGTDGEQTLQSERWAAYLALTQHKLDTEKFGELVADHFKAFTDFADEAAARQLAITGKDWSTITVTEAVEGVLAEDFQLDEAGTILRILAETDGSSLIWVNGELESVI